MKLSDTVRITEIFYSLQGETTFVGLPTVFIRLTGCPLRCHYCDTAYAFHHGEKWTIETILTEVKRHQTPYVTVTGGEPLAQIQCLALLAALDAAGYRISLETSGALSVALVPPSVIKIVDIKTPGSGEVTKNLWDNLTHLQPHDQLKFVICDRMDYDWAKAKIDELALWGRYELLFSPSFTQLKPSDLAEWILADHLAVRLQIQLHKVLWGDVQGK